MKNLLVVFVLVSLVFSLSACTKSYEVSFLDSNGDSIIKSITVDANSLIQEPNDPQKEGHTFLGWYDESYEVPFNFEEFIVNEDVEIYAKWETNLYSIFYVDHEGNPLLTVVTGYGSPISLSTLQIPERQGFILSGWSPMLPPTMPAHDITISPDYTPIMYNLTLNSLSVIIDILNVNIDEVITLPILSDDDMTFLGWTELGGDIITSYTHDKFSSIALDAVWSYELNDVTYTIINDKAYVKSYDGYATELVIPDEVLGVKVVSILENVFRGTAIETLDLPMNLQNLDYSALENMNLLRHINVDENNQYFTSIDGVLFNKDVTKLIRYPSDKAGESYVILDSVVDIEASAFLNAYQISELIFSDTGTLESIGDYAFWGMNNLQNLELPEGLISIGSLIYSDHMKLSYIIIPESVTHISAPAFPNYMLTKHVIYMKANEPGVDFEPLWDDTRFTIVFGFQETVIQDGILYALTSSNKAILVDAEGARPATSIVIPEMIGSHQVTEIGAFAFLLQAELISVQLPSSIEYIRRSAFSLCIALENINLEELINLKVIDGYAFERTNLVDVVLPDSLEYIRFYAFRNMDLLETLYIPENVLLVEGGIVEGSDLVVIRLERTEVPETWVGFWNYENRPVVFGYVK